MDKGLEEDRVGVGSLTRSVAVTRRGGPGDLQWAGAALERHLGASQQVALRVRGGGVREKGRCEAPPPDHTWNSRAHTWISDLAPRGRGAIRPADDPHTWGAAWGRVGGVPKLRCLAECLLWNSKRKWRRVANPQTGVKRPQVKTLQEQRRGERGTAEGEDWEGAAGGVAPGTSVRTEGGPWPQECGTTDIKVQNDSGSSLPPLPSLKYQFLPLTGCVTLNKRSTSLCLWSPNCKGILLGVNESVYKKALEEHMASTT